MIFFLNWRRFSWFEVHSNYDVQGSIDTDSHAVYYTAFVDFINISGIFSFNQSNSTLVIFFILIFARYVEEVSVGR